MAVHRLAFMGSPDLGEPCLRALAEAADLDLLHVITLGDRRRGRRGKTEPTAIGATALELGLPLMRWEKGERAKIQARLVELELDALIVIAFARILPAAMLALPRFGCLNLHASLLPWGRGASPIQSAILEGRAESGWSAMIMEEGLDTGPVLDRLPLAIGADWTSAKLYSELKECAPTFLLRVLRRWCAGELELEIQDESLASMTRKIPREAGALDWKLPAHQLERRLRAFFPAPGCWCRCDGERLGIEAARVAPGRPGAEPGRILEIDPSLLVACGEGALELLTLRPAGKRGMPARDYLNGHPLNPGDILENG